MSPSACVAVRRAVIATAATATLALAAGCGSDDQPEPGVAPSDAASSASAGPKPSPSSSSAADEPTDSPSAEDSPAGGPVSGKKQNQALLAAGATAEATVSGSTVTSIDAEQRDTRWEVELVGSDGEETTVTTSVNGKQIVSEPIAGQEDAEDRAENRRSVAAAKIDYAQAVKAIEAARPGRINELNLDEDDGRYVWESDVRAGTAKYEVSIDAGSGQVVTNREDRD